VGIKVENDFVIPAPVENAWKVLIDVPRVVPCMPGSAVTEEIDAQHFRATARIKVGPVELHFRGEGEFLEIDPVVHSAKLRAKGSDAKGRGSFQAEMAFVLTPQGDETRAIVNTDITLSGSVAQYGRGAGLIKEITNQLTAQFAGNLSALIAAERVVQQAANRTAAPASANTPTSNATDQGTPSPQGVAKPIAPASEARANVPISGMSLLFAALKAMVRRWLGLKT
jgi:uncharacterized protein